MLDDSHKSVAVIIRDEFTDKQKHKLCQHVFNVVRCIDTIEIWELAVVISRGRFNEVVLEAIKSFFQNSMQMDIL